MVPFLTLCVHGREGDPSGPLIPSRDSPAELTLLRGLAVKQQRVQANSAHFSWRIGWQSCDCLCFFLDTLGMTLLFAACLAEEVSAFITEPELY